jgi:hypothetical protein
MDFWWNIGQLDSTAFFVTLASASRIINQTHPSEPRESSEAITLYTKSIQCLQKRLQAPMEGLGDGVIITILEFAYYDVETLLAPALRTILIGGEVSRAGSRKVVGPHGWSRSHCSAERWNTYFKFFRDNPSAQLLV